MSESTSDAEARRAQRRRDQQRRRRLKAQEKRSRRRKRSRQRAAAKAQAEADAAEAKAAKKAARKARRDNKKKKEEKPKKKSSASKNITGRKHKNRGERRSPSPNKSDFEDEDDEDNHNNYCPSSGRDTASGSCTEYSDSGDGAQRPVPTVSFDNIGDAAGAGGGLSHVPDTASKYNSRKVMNGIIDRPWQRAGTDYTPGTELRRELLTGVHEQVEAASITFRMDSDDNASGFKRQNNNNVAAPHIACRETFRFVTDQAIERCEQMSQRMHVELGGARRLRLGTSVVRRLLEHRDFYVAGTAAWSTFRSGVLRRWDRAYDPTIGRSARLEINGRLSNYVNWVLRALIRDNVFIARWNPDFYDDVRNRRAPQPARRQLKDHIAAAEVAALGAYQTGGGPKKDKGRSDTTTRDGGRRQDSRDGGRRQETDSRRDNDACPHPSAHVLFAGTCYRCGETDHMTPTCSFPKLEADMTPAQLAKYKAIKKKREAAGKKRDDWYKARRGRKR